MDVKKPYRMVKYFIKNTINWFPILVSDRQWDSYHLERVIQHKLSLMETFYRRDDLMMADSEQEKILATLAPAKEAADRLVEDDYIRFPENKDEWPDFSFEPIDDEYSRLKTVYHENFTKEQADKVYADADRMEIEDRELLYDTLKKHSTEWWD